MVSNLQTCVDCGCIEEEPEQFDLVLEGHICRGCAVQREREEALGDT